MVDLGNMTLVKQGAEARLYTGQFLGQEVVVKERFSKKYRHPALDSQLTKDRHRAEARSLLKCKQIGVRVPTMFLCDSTQFIIVMQNLSQASTAKDCINKLLGENNRDQLVRLAREVGGVVAKMHQAGLIHGDLTSSNILVEKTADSTYQLSMIDFGLSSQEGSAEDKGVDLYVLERALLSTHPNTEWLFQEMMDHYKLQYGKGVGEVVRKFEEIRLRGRKRTMVG